MKVCSRQSCLLLLIFRIFFLFHYFRVSSFQCFCLDLPNHQFTKNGTLVLFSMINHIHGKLVEKTPTYIVIDCGGVGYFIHISLQTFSKLSDSEYCKVFTHLSIKEDAHLLYGFAEDDERKLFRQLISVSGIGEATARVMLSSLSPTEIQQAIITDNVSLLQSVKGIGSKTAQRIIIDLKDKFKKGELVAETVLPLSSNNRIKEQALSALVTLGFAKNAAEKVILSLLKNNQSELTVEELIKLALNNL